MAERTPDRLVRLLGMVAYLDGQDGVPVDQLATHFGVTPEQVLRDVDTLWMSGTPGYWPDDLIDFDAGSLESGVVRLVQARGMSRALRLGTREAVVLVAALRALQESVAASLEPHEAAVLASTLDTLAAATGEAAATVDVHLAVDASPEVVRAARSGIRQGRRLRLRYVNASDTMSERDVDPWQLLTGDEHSYLRAWCHSARGERMFRLDRVLHAEVLDQPATRAPGPAREAATFRASDEHDLVTLDLDGRARWVAEQLPVEEITELPDDGFRVSLRVASPAWLRHLLLRLAQDVRAVDPPHLAADAAAAAGRALAAYGESAGAGLP